MKILILFFAMFSIGIFNNAELLAYDDINTHPKISDIAVKSSSVDIYLKNNFGNQFPIGTESILNGIKLIDWLTKGSTDEDSPACRASNHFHDPLQTWGESGMSDEPLWLDSWTILPPFHPTGQSSLLQSQDSEKQKTFAGEDWGFVLPRVVDFILFRA